MQWNMKGNTSVSQSVVHGGSPCGQRRFPKKKISKILSDTIRIKNTPIQVCAKTAFVGWPSTESMRISSFRNFLSWVWGILRSWSACSPTAYEVVRACWTFEIHCHKEVSAGNSTSQLYSVKGTDSGLHAVSPPNSNPRRPRLGRG
jgi:hypothetical protein